MRNLLLTIMLLVSAGIFLLFWLSPPEAFLKKPSSNTGELPKADSYMLNISKLDFGKDGSQAFFVEATEARHFRRSNRLELDQPKLVSYSSQNLTKPWHMTAETGTILKGGQRAIFKGSVYAWQNLENGKKNELRTEKLILFPNKHIAETDVKVTITTPRGETVGVGMWANLDNELFKLLSKVKGIHHVH
ncbi:MAG: LPS export ABC transporter periplasmic protein LptC [Porticoccaceae bacterium]|nr:MAG: LPS export ABC transporter periplasmic protein LptC [Porticoccaceae bacterium]